MNLMNRLERKFGRFAIPNLMYYVAMMYLLGVILSFINPYFYYTFLSLDAGMILKGQVWRLVTFLICPPSSGIFFNLIAMYLYYSLGTTLERTWGTFRFNMYFFMGVLGHIAAAFLVYGIFHVSWPITTYYLNESLFLAFAVTFPEMVFYFFGLVPIKAKWFGAIIGIQFAVEFVRGGMPARIAILVSLLNFIIFFMMTRDMTRLSPQEIMRKEKFRRAANQDVITKMRPSAGSGTIHRCAVCGRTEKDDPSLEFRYCSKCAGNMEYCMEHLYTHVHVTDKNGGENG
ncbi:MAG: hypothetical protein K6E83_06185 [Clostridium sp.]|nr:hypothetical protein [Clostridium sp.]